MSTLKFIFGPVSSGKTMDLILRATQLQNFKGPEKIRIFKPSIDTRFSSKVVKSATGLQIRVTDLISPIDDLSRLDLSGVEHIIIDEIQFFTVKQIEQLRVISIEMDIEITCYGLLKDFKLRMFEASKKLVELCDEFSQVTSYCSCCSENGERHSNSASMSMKINQKDGVNVPVVEGESICIGGIETYVPVCYDCFHKKVNTKPTC